MGSPPEGEPEAGPWRVEPIGALVRLLLERAPAGRSAVVAVDGRSSSGKTTLSRRLAAAIPGSALVHTDDIAWWQAVLDWDDLLRDGILAPVSRGEPVRFRPPRWDERGRAGAIEVPAATTTLIVEGVGSSRRALVPHLDAALWVQSNAEALHRRNAVRVAAGEPDPAAYAGWMAEENPFFLADRPWQRAVAVVAGTPPIPHDPASEVVLAPPISV